MRNRKAFTLIELLVVVAIISLLVSILMPSLSKAKQLATGAVCAANHRSLGHGFLLYAEEHQQVWPRTLSCWSNTTSLGHFDDWVCCIAPYVGVSSTAGYADSEAGYQQWVQAAVVSRNGGPLWCPGCPIRPGYFTETPATYGVFTNTYNISFKETLAKRDWWQYAYSLNARCTRAQDTPLLGDKIAGPFNWCIIGNERDVANARPGMTPTEQWDWGTYYSHADNINILFNDGHVISRSMLPPPYQQVRGAPNLNYTVTGGWDHTKQLLTVAPNYYGVLYWESL